MITTDNNTILKEKARTIRRHVVNMIFEAGTGHPGGSLSCVDIITVLYFHEMRCNSSDPNKLDRDRFILSKGHAAPTLYATLAECGYFSVNELPLLRKFGCLLQGHPDISIPGVEASTGSLGQGLSISCGIAIAAKMDDKDSRIYTLLGDGECDEGQVWEAAIFASHYKLDNLCAIIDRNQFQIDNATEKVIALEPLRSKWDSFGWNVKTINGHNFLDLIDCLNFSQKIPHKPTLIIANTIKGKGISFMEGQNSFHGKCLNSEEMKNALKELDDSNE